ncbi:WD40 repeat domain-containing protein [Actinoplanes sp. NPDC004185]
MTSSARQGVPEWAEAMAVTVGRTLAIVSPYAGLNVHLDDAPTEPNGWGSVLARHDDLLIAADGNSVRRTGDGLGWSAQVSGTARQISISADGRFVAVAAGGPDAVRILDAEEGRPLWDLPGDGTCAFHPTQPTLLAVTRTGSGYGELTIVDVARGTPVAHRPIDNHELGQVVWSPAGDRLAAGTRNGVLVWSTVAWALDVRPEPADDCGMLGRIAWSPDGQRLAAAPGDPRRAAVHVWDTATWRVTRRLGQVTGFHWSTALCWSPDSTALAVLASTEVIEIWDVLSGARLAAVSVPGGSGRRRAARSLSWSSPARIEIGTAHGARLTCVFSPSPAEVRQPVVPLAYGYRPDDLAELGAAVAAAGCGAPLRLLADLLAATAAADDRPTSALGEAARSAAMSRLRDLDWPMRARYGIVLLIAGQLPGMMPPPPADRDALRSALLRALTAYHRPPEPVEIHSDAVSTAVDRMVARCLGLLTVLGPRAVAADPLLPVRLLGLPPLPELPPPARELLNQRPLGGDLRHQGAGTGGGATGLSRRGPLSRLLPRELAVRQPPLAVRFANHDLLYRNTQGADPRLHSAIVLIMDDTPPAFGRVGVTLRSLAHLVGARRAAAADRFAVISLGRPEDVRWIAQPTDLVLLWDRWLTGPAQPAKAARVIASLGAGPVQPILLTQPFLEFPGTRGLLRVDVVRPGAGSGPAGPDRHRLVTDPATAEFEAALTFLTLGAPD